MARSRSGAKQDLFEYSEFIKRFNRPDITNKPVGSDLIGSQRVVASLRSRIDDLLGPGSVRQNHTLITGPSRTGKTFVIHRVALSYPSKKLNYIYLKSSWTLEKQFGNPEEQLREIFDFAIKRSPSLIFIDRLDSICEKKRNANDVSRVFNVLEDRLECLSGLGAKVLVFAATNRPEVLDPQITCYFGDEIRFNLPSPADRGGKLIETIRRIDDKHEGMTASELGLIVESTHCYSFSDIEILCCNATRHSNGDTLKYSHFLEAISSFKPVLVRSVTSPCPPVAWEDIGGFESIKLDLQVSVIWPLKHRGQFQKLGLAPIKGILLYGPPGCSKTMLAQALATESGYNFISIKGPELNSKYVGESEAAIRKLYKNARDIAPCIIFFDEIEAMAPERSEDSNSPVGDRVTAQLLTELNGVEPLDNVFTIAATNRPNKVDSALLRPGRLDPAIYVSLPTRDDRVKIFLVHMKKLGQLELGIEIDKAAEQLADKTIGYSGADIARICQVAGELALREDPSRDDLKIEWRHFDSSLERVKPKTRPSQLKGFAKFHEMTLQLGQRESLAPGSPYNSTFFSDEFHKLNIN